MAAECGIAAGLLREVERCSAIPRLTLLDKRVSPQDGFAKYLFRGEADEPFEAVRIPLLHRPDDRKYVVCVSSQVGCALGCRFCATGRMGFRRDLAAWEIVDQVTQIHADSMSQGCEEMGTGTSRQPKGDSPIFANTKIGTVPSEPVPISSQPYPVRGVVFMGMGEPMLNYDRVIQAARILHRIVRHGHRRQGHHDFNCRHRARHPAVHRRKAAYRLVVSLNIGRSGRRRELMPVEKAYPTPESDRVAARVSCGDGPAGRLGMDHDRGREYAAWKTPGCWPI